MPNRLANSNSPYLVQHAANPVDWYPWGEEALARARDEHKPIFLSIGYAACHWCHVMAHESFEDPSIAAILNENFVCIKVDREERPDLDSIYMAATVAMTGSGGWPMSVFLTPDLQPFYAGTYFPPVARYNMPSFRDLLTSIISVWQNEREKVFQVGSQVTGHIRQATRASAASALPLTQQLLDNAADHLYQSYDWGFGGWGGAPKFPQPMTIEFLFSRATQPGQPEKRQNYIKAATHALHAMARGGMYDVVGGGFARYSVDNLWRVPHFEKMLYDNAQLARAYLHAWKLTGEPFYRQVVVETLDFVLREMTHPEGGFYSSLDADSEHEEGKFYVWRYAEIEATLGEDFEFFKAAYGLTPQGNWEGKIVLQRALDDSTLAARTQTSRDLLAAKLAGCHARLLEVRNRRVRPGTDDKILTSWNALMLQTFAETANCDEELNQKYKEISLKSANFLLEKLRPSGKLKHSWRKNNTTNEVFLEDYAALVNALLAVYVLDFNNSYFVTALELADEMISKFDDPAGAFFDTADNETNLLMRPQDTQDNATPSGNALACLALLKLSAYTDRADFRAKAEQMLGMVTEQAAQYPTAFAQWLQAADFALGNVKQVAVVGDLGRAETQALLAELRLGYFPRLVAASAPIPLPKNAPDLLNERPLLNGKPTAYVCENFACNLPVNEPDELRKQLTKD